ncbi:hypothetical protein HPB50_003681 [Hyalomma asiaticum]|uniref:Uncharacterized protein n=1 Tax=Hyalomma asiaticum TaxID=266040 RepID=A0ACB7SS93_HYAAI|nr:hypothetical protein HPB50_003681 [Hyalomma asiaticum]
MDIGEAKQLPAIDAAGTRKRRARTKSSRSTKPTNCATGTTQTPPASGWFRETGTVPSEPTRAARISPRTICTSKIKILPTQAKKPATIGEKARRLQGPASLLPKFAHTHHSQTSHGAATLKNRFDDANFRSDHPIV